MSTMAISDAVIQGAEVALETSGGCCESITNFGFMCWDGVQAGVVAFGTFVSDTFAYIGEILAPYFEKAVEYYNENPTTVWVVTALLVSTSLVTAAIVAGATFLLSNKSAGVSAPQAAPVNTDNTAEIPANSENGAEASEDASSTQFLADATNAATSPSDANSAAPVNETETQ